VTWCDRIPYKYLDLKRFDWLISNWVRAFRSRCTHLCLKNRLFVSHINLWESCSFAKFPDDPQTYTLNPLTWKIWWAPNNASRWQMGFNSAFNGLMSSGSKKTKPIHHVWVKPKPHTHRECGLRFHPLHHTTYTRDCWLAPFSEDVFSRHCVQWEGKLQPWIVPYQRAKIWSLQPD